MTSLIFSSISTWSFVFVVQKIILSCALLAMTISSFHYLANGMSSMAVVIAYFGMVMTYLAMAVALISICFKGETDRCHFFCKSINIYWNCFFFHWYSSFIEVGSIDINSFNDGFMPCWLYFYCYCY